MPASSGFTYIRPPGARSAAPLPTQQVQNYQNQDIAGLINGTAPQIGAQARTPLEGVLSPEPQSPVALSTSRTNKAVRLSGQRMLASAQIQRQRRDALAAQQAQRGAGGANTGSAGPMYRSGSYGGGGGGGGGYAGGPAVSRVQSILKRFPGLRITETLGNRDYDVAHGVDRVPNSYHYDRNNPAVDIAGSPAELNALYKELLRVGGWRQILWQVPGHYDHIHVAADGGEIGMDSPYAAKTVPGPMRPVGADTVPTMLEPGEFVVTKEAKDRVGADKLAAVNDGANLEDVAAPAPQQAPAQPMSVKGMDVTPLVATAYRSLGQHAAQHLPMGSTVAGVRTSLRNLQPGDLVAWRDGSHVAVYAGNGEVVESMSPAGPIKRPLWAPESAVYGIALKLPGE